MESGNATWDTDYILLGLFPTHRYPSIFMSIILLIYFLAILGNATLVFLIVVDSRLHTPMYFLLCQLSIIDLAYVSTTVPKMAMNFFSGSRTISRVGCGTQMFFWLMLADAECVLLTLMAYDRYVAVCNPLRYTTIMSPTVCLQMAIGSWIGGVLNSVAQTIYTMHFPTCDNREINHFFCEMPAILTLSCEDTSGYLMVIMVMSIIYIIVPLSLIITSYLRIFLTVLRMNSPEGRNKALATCSSHLTVVSLYLGPGIVVYMAPASSHTPEMDQGLSVFYTILTPMLNPLIYSLRNKEVIGALKKVMCSTWIVQ
ncbi:PREDICTED: olfactory receptor 2T1-like [Elephantulus edwardii]|uniref:olfactory receptor 2T1-like n=1 Tax=Elephantulus edwardii TaxID=28737 RepID=UPI0003F07A36|nr:PREDICTED: olfactory receptor 2T1-like [Elephantulus edwardii]